IFGIICMACASPAWASATHWFLFVAVISFIKTVIWIFIYLLSIREALVSLHINWLLTEFINTCVVVVLYFIAFIVQLSARYPYGWRDVNITAGVFGLFNTIAYAAGAYFLFLDFRSVK
ncbi:hypothetical protein L9F63_015217, partial [Diploptera punctata]